MFVEEFKKERQNYEKLLEKADKMNTSMKNINIPTWIMKPVGRAQGKGIFLFRKLKDIQDWKRKEMDTTYAPNNVQGTNRLNNMDLNKSSLDSKDGSAATVEAHSGSQVRENWKPNENRENVETYVVSRYIDNPYLIMGKKFDIRMYVLVTSFSPMVIWMHREGFARFSNQRFSLEDIDNNIVHLTNVAIQKTAEDYDPEKGAKWSLESLRTYLTHKHGSDKTATVFNQISRTVIRSLQSVKKSIISDKHCFELYGYDLMLDDALKIWLIEVNASPSLTASSRDDYEMKFGLIWDTLDVIDMEKKRSGKERRVGGFDLIWDEESKSEKTEKSDDKNNTHKTRYDKRNVDKRNHADQEDKLNNHAVHFDPAVQNSTIFKHLPSYPTNSYCGCTFDRQKIFLEK